jgi:hypothetical protein
MINKIKAFLGSHVDLIIASLLLFGLVVAIVVGPPTREGAGAHSADLGAVCFAGGQERAATVIAYRTDSPWLVIEIDGLKMRTNATCYVEYRE